ncbi:MAG: RNA polymerase sigma factor [Omnitrophica WOR_2 bacterium]
MNISDSSDLLRRVKRFDLQALGEVYDLYSPGLYGYAFRLLGDASLAEDCVAETFSRFLQVLKTGRGPQDYLQAYLYRIAHNWVTDQYRRQPPPSLSLEDEQGCRSDSHPERETIQRLEQEQVRAALYRLTPEQRQVVILKFIEGWENDSIAKAIDKPIGAVKSLQHRALEALRRILAAGKKEPEGYEVLRRAD